MKRLFHFTPAKVWLISSLILVIFIQVNCNAQNPAFHYKKIPDKYKISQPDQSSYEQKIDSLKGLAFDLTNSLPQGYATDGSVDYTTYLQQGIQAHANVIFPNFPVMIGPRGLTLISNSCLIFKEQSKLIMMPNSQSNYQAIRLNNLKNVTLYGPIIQGDRDQHKAAKGEWGMGIWIAGCDGVKIYDAHISDCWGDGIYIGKGIAPSHNIALYYPVLDNNRRNGISVVSVVGLLIQSPLVSNTNGTMPMSGIDIEPNTNEDDADNIDIENAVTYNNMKHGILIVLDRLSGVKQKSLNIRINNHIDDGSGIGFGFHNLTGPDGKRPFAGHIDIDNAKWKNNNTSFSMYKSFRNGAAIKFNNVRVLRQDGSSYQPGDNDVRKQLQQ